MAAGSVELTGGEALLVVDVQVDFCPGGALAVREGDRVVPVLTALAGEFARAGAPVYASRDWHPPDARHFARWPVHCVRGTPGARFHPDLRLPAGAVILSKGLGAEADGYSAFEGTSDSGATLEGDLRSRGVRRLYVGGLATDYCVRASVLDALARGFAATVVTRGCRAVDLEPGDGARALEEMARAGAELLT